MTPGTLYIVVPCYKEEAVLPETNRQLCSLLQSLISSSEIDERSRVMYVDDGSPDTTWQLIEQYSASSNLVCGVKLAANSGHQHALLAGLHTAQTMCDMTVSIDADLQDDINAIREMVKLYHEGNDIVYGVRQSRETDTFFKRNTALAFYKVMKWLGVRSVYNHADFRLMSRRAVEQLCRYRERNLFLRGLVPLLGFTTKSVYYDRAERFAGESKYPFGKMLAFALDGITSFSIKPITVIFVVGLCCFVVGLVVLAWGIYSYIRGSVVPGWTSLLVSLWLIGGVVIMSLGCIGEYVGKIYVEVKHRPRYHIEKIV